MTSILSYLSVYLHKVMEVAFRHCTEILNVSSENRNEPHELYSVSHSMRPRLIHLKKYFGIFYEETTIINSTDEFRRICRFFRRKSIRTKFIANYFEMMIRNHPKYMRPFVMGWLQFLTCWIPWLKAIPIEQSFIIYQANLRGIIG